MEDALPPKSRCLGVAVIRSSLQITQYSVRDMSFADLHPEALLERETNGTLDQRDRALLEKHRESCEACRFERRVRDDFAQELADAEPLPDLRVSDLDGLSDLLGSAEDPAPVAHRRRLRTRIRVSVAWLGPAAIVFGSGAGMGAGLLGRVLSGLERQAPAPTPHAMASAPDGPRAEPAATTTLTGADPPAAWAKMAPAPAKEQEPAPTARTSPTNSSKFKSSPEPLSVPSNAEASPSTAASLFEAESNARRRGDYVEALSLHRDLEARFSQSVEAQVSRAVMGRGLLDRGRAEDALSCFDHYLAFGSGDLGEEVMEGRATALERLERTEEARAAWRRLLETYPATPYASRAMARLEPSGVL